MFDTRRASRSLFALLVLFTVSIVAFSEHVNEMDAKSFQKAVLDSRNPYLVFFYDSDMVQNEEGHSALINMESTLQNSVSPYGIGYVTFDCAAKKKGNKPNVKICGTVGLSTIPGIGMYTDMPEINPYTNKNGRTIKMYQGGDPTDVKKIERSLVSKNYPTSSLSSIKSTSGDISGEMEEALDKAKEIGKHALLVFNTKDTISLFTKSVCHAYGDLPCIHVAGLESTEISAQLGVGVETLPALVVRAPDGTGFVYPADFKVSTAEGRDKVLAWIAETSGTAASGREDTGQPLDSDNGDEGDVRKRKMNARSEDEVLSSIKKTAGGDFQAASLNEDGAWVLLVSQQGHSSLSEDDQAAWMKLVHASEGAVQPEEVVCEGVDDSSTAYGAQLCRERSLPYVVVVPYGDEDDREGVLASPIRKSHIYELKDNAKAKSAALNTLPDEVSYITESELESFMGLCFGANRVGLLVMSDKAEAPAMLRNVRWTLHREDIAHVGFLSEPSKNLMGQLGMPPDMPLPAVFVLHQAKQAPEGAPPGTAATSLVPYDPMMFGPMKFRSLLNFVLSAYHNAGYADAKMQDQGGEGQDPTSQFGDFSGAAGDVTPALVASEEDWVRECPSTFKGICAIAFTKAGFEESVAEVSTSVIASLGKSAAAFKFLTVNGPCQLSFGDRFDVSYEMMPAYAIYSPVKARAAAFKGTMEADKVREFLEGALIGKTNTFPLAQRPSMNSECEMDEAAAEEMIEEEEPMDDFLEEIRREEEEKQAALKRELQEEAKKRKEEEKARKEAEEAAPRKVKKVIKKKKKKAKSEL